MHPVSMTSLMLNLMWEDYLCWLAGWYCFCHSAWWLWEGCLLSRGSADCGRLGNQTPDFSYYFKFIWSL